MLIICHGGVSADGTKLSCYKKTLLHKSPGNENGIPLSSTLSKQRAKKLCQGPPTESKSWELIEIPEVSVMIKLSGLMQKL